MYRNIIKISGILIITLLLFSNFTFLKAVEKAPEFQLTDLNGKQVALKELLKKGPVIIDFWATWCKPCVKSLPEIQKLYQKYKNDSLTIVGINVDGPRNRSKVKPFVKSMGLEFPILIDENGEVIQRYRLMSIPSTVIVSSDGNIVKVLKGYRPGDENFLEKEIKELLNNAKYILIFTEPNLTLSQ